MCIDALGLTVDPRHRRARLHAHGRRGEAEVPDRDERARRADDRRVDRDAAVAGTGTDRSATVAALREAAGDERDARRDECGGAEEARVNRSHGAARTTITPFIKGWG